MPRRETSRVSTLFSTLKVMVCALVKLIAERFTRETAKAPAKAAETPLRLIVLSPDGNSDNDFPQDSPPFKLCHGARHRLEVRAPDGSTWVGQKLSLHWEVGRPSTYGLSAIPPFKSDSTLPPEDEASYLCLSSETGANWELSAKGGAAQSGNNLLLALGSYWKAPKYKFSMDVGDFHFVVTELTWNEVVPIVDPPTSTVLTATVNSPFDDARVMSGKRVSFKLNGADYGEPVLTGEDGKACLSYTPLAGEVGADNRVTFSAFCKDDLEQTSESEPLVLPAFASNAWPAQLKVELRDDEGTLIPSSVLGARLTQGGHHTLILVPEAGSSFVGQPTKLLWPGEWGQLGIELSPSTDEPEHGRPLPEAGLGWDVRGGGESGQFNLLVAMSAAQMPFLLTGVQMSGNLADEADLEVTIEVKERPPIFHRGIGKAVRIVPKAGSLLGEMELAATLHFQELETQFPQRQVQATPDYGMESETVTAAGVEWVLRPRDSGDGNSGQFGLEVRMPGFRTALKLDKALALSDMLSEEAQVFIDDSDVPLDGNVLVLRRNKPLTIRLVPQAHSGLGRTPLKGCLTFESEGLSEGQVPAVPDYRDMQAMAEGGLSWTLTGGDVSGSLKLAIHVEGFSGPTVLAKVVLLSQHLSDEGDLITERVSERVAPIFQVGVSKSVRFVPKTDSPLGLAELSATLKFIQKEAQLSEAYLPATPGYGEPEPVTPNSGVTWAIVPTENRGEFGLRVEIPGFTESLDMETGYLMSRHLGDEINMYINEVYFDRVMKLKVNVLTEILVMKPDKHPKSPLGRTRLLGWLNLIEGGGGIGVLPDFTEKIFMDPGGIGWRIASDKYPGAYTLEIWVEGFDTPKVINVVTEL